MSITYTAVLDFSRETVLYLARLLHAERRARGTRRAVVPVSPRVFPAARGPGARGPGARGRGGHALQSRVYDPRSWGSPLLGRTFLACLSRVKTRIRAAELCVRAASAEQGQPYQVMLQT